MLFDLIMGNKLNKVLKFTIKPDLVPIDIYLNTLNRTNTALVRPLPVPKEPSCLILVGNNLKEVGYVEPKGPGPRSGPWARTRGLTSEPWALVSRSKHWSGPWAHSGSRIGPLRL